MEESRKKICIIGAGPTGLLAIQHLTKVDTSGQDIVCFEKQSTFGGLWNFTWRTGIDEYGEPCHNGMYRDLTCNIPKEMTELPQYTYDEHFGRPVPSYLKREENLDYLRGFTEKFNLKQFIKFNMVVKFVKYDEQKDTFSVTVSDLLKEETFEDEFSHVVVANGIFSTPYQPDIPGIETFKGLLLHSHDMRNFDILKGMKVLSIGSGFSSVDTALMAIKYGAENVCISYNNNPLLFGWPEGIRLKPQVVKIESGTAYFEDGSCMSPDALIMCTGYKVNFPFMENDLRLRTKLSFYPDDLYKGVLFTKGGNNKVFYAGVHFVIFSFSLVNLQAEWIARYIHRLIKGEPVLQTQMSKDMTVWTAKRDKLQFDIESWAAFVTEYNIDLCNALGIDSQVYEKLNSMYRPFLDALDKDALTYRDARFRSAYTGTLAASPDEPWFTSRQKLE